MQKITPNFVNILKTQTNDVYLYKMHIKLQSGQISVLTFTDEKGS